MITSSWFCGFVSDILVKIFLHQFAWYGYSKLLQSFNQLLFISMHRHFWYFGWKISGLMEILLISSEVIPWYSSSQQYFGFPKVAMCFDGTLIRVWESDQNPILQMQPPPRWSLLLPHKILNNWTDPNPRLFLSQYYIWVESRYDQIWLTFFFNEIALFEFLLGF